MAQLRPYYRCVRPRLDGEYEADGIWMYVMHPDYARDAAHYIRAFSILQADLTRLFEYIEPADANARTYSYRCLELLIRACGEVEANCKAIFRAHEYDPGRKSSMAEYRKLDDTHRLSSYRVRLPVWTGDKAVRTPFGSWAENRNPPWFKAHHGAKHNRHAEFTNATLEHALDAVCAVFVLLSAQFLTFQAGPVLLAISDGRDAGGFTRGIGDYFEVAFPNDWPIEERYTFDWATIQGEPAPFRRLTFPP